MQILELIENIKQSEIERGRDPKLVYTRGNCGNLYTIIKQHFPNATPYEVDFCGHHIITKLDDLFYDIYGIYNPKDMFGESWQDNIKPATDARIKQCSNNYNTENKVKNLNLTNPNKNPLSRVL